jgi:uncharacterized protein YPO0396
MPDPDEIRTVVELRRQITERFAAFEAEARALRADMHKLLDRLLEQRPAPSSRVPAPMTDTPETPSDIDAALAELRQSLTQAVEAVRVEVGAKAEELLTQLNSAVDTAQAKIQAAVDQRNA